MNAADLPVRPKPWRRATPAGGQPTPEIATAFERTLTFFADRSTRPAVLVRGMLGRPASGDATANKHLVRERRRKTRMNGSIRGSLVETATTLAELLDLACPPDHAAVVRTLGYVLSRQNAPGHFGEGCTPKRHARGECRHALNGFFSPATQDDEFVAPQFPNGLVVGNEDDARFAASCYALRVVLRAGEDRRTPVRDHVESLIALEPIWDLGNDRWPNALRTFAVAALGVAPYEYRKASARCAAAWIDAQEPHGNWPGVDLIACLDALMGFTGVEASRALRRAVPALLALQRDDGAFSKDADEEATLIAVRVLLRSTT